jgi:hypothetical protein
MVRHLLMGDMSGRESIFKWSWWQCGAHILRCLWEVAKDIVEHKVALLLHRQEEGLYKAAACLALRMTKRLASVVVCFGSPQCHDREKAPSGPPKLTIQTISCTH